MRRALFWTMALGIVVGSSAVWSQGAVQSPAPASAEPAQTPKSTENPVPATPNPVTTGGKLHGVVKSGTIPLPGVTVTAQNTLTGKKFSTTTDLTGAWSMNISQNGRYVIRTQFAAFAVGSQEAVLNATNHDQTVSFALILASRAAQQQAPEAASQQATSSMIDRKSGATAGDRGGEPTGDKLDD